VLVEFYATTPFIPPDLGVIHSSTNSKSSAHDLHRICLVTVSSPVAMVRFRCRSWLPHSGQVAFSIVTKTIGLGLRGRLTGQLPPGADERYPMKALRLLRDTASQCVNDGASWTGL